MLNDANRCLSYGRRAIQAAGAFWLVMALLATSAWAQERVTMAQTSPSLMRLPFYVAQHNGYFEDEGLEFQMVDTRSGSDAAMMLAGGSVNLIMGQLVEGIRLNREGIHVQGIAMLTQRLGNSIVVRTELADEVKSLRDLQGRTIGITGVGSGTWQFAAYLAGLEGMSVEDLNLVSVGAGGAIVGAFLAGRVDAMSYVDPENMLLVNDGDAAFLIDMADDETHRRYIGDTYMNNQIMTLASFAEDRPEILQGVVNAIQRAINWVHEHSIEEVAELIHPSFSGVDYDTFLLALGRTLPDGVARTALISRDAFDNAIKLPIAVGVIDEAMPYEVLVNPTFAENAAAAYPPAER